MFIKFYFEDGDLIQAKLDSNYIPLTSSVISLNISIYSYDRTRVNLYENDFYLANQVLILKSTAKSYYQP